MTRRYISPSVKQVLVRMSYRRKPSDIARDTGINESTIYRVLKLHRETGCVVRKPLCPGRKRILNSLDVAYLVSLIERTPDSYLSELRDALYNSRGVDVDESTISRTLYRRGYTRKKVSRPALERNEDRRAEYQAHVATHYLPEQLVFLDESALNRFTTRREWAWSLVNTTARRHDHFVRGQRYSILPALSLDGILHLDVQDHSYTAETFNAFVDVLLDNMNPFPQRNSVVVMDNASIHKSAALEEMVLARGMRILYLPPYSPDMNPIEESFSAIKSWIRCNREYACGELSGDETCNPYKLIWDAFRETITIPKIEGWFHDCGYLQ